MLSLITLHFKIKPSEYNGVVPAGGSVFCERRWPSLRASACDAVPEECADAQSNNRREDVRQRTGRVGRPPVVFLIEPGARRQDSLRRRLL